MAETLLAAPARERPIIMTGESVRAILDGRKTQSRRVLTTQPLEVLRNHDSLLEGVLSWSGLMQREPARGTVFRCRHGQPGDRLWVREAWQANAVGNAGAPEGDALLAYRADGAVACPTIGAANSEQAMRLLTTDNRWHSPIHMPRWASRLTLELTGVRVERLQDISHEDVLAEGIDLCNSSSRIMALERLEKLWDSLNGKRAPWESNPWVWVLEFQRVEVAHG